jgi:hypothetical protein
MALRRRGAGASAVNPRRLCSPSTPPTPERRITPRGEVRSSFPLRADGEGQLGPGSRRGFFLRPPGGQKMSPDPEYARSRLKVTQGHENAGCSLPRGAILRRSGDAVEPPAEPAGAPSRRAPRKQPVVRTGLTVGDGIFITIIVMRVALYRRPQQLPDARLDAPLSPRPGGANA